MIKFDSITIQEDTFPCVYCDAVIVGTGCAGFNCADTLWNLGVKDIIVISNGINSGTSRNTGSDKQTFYKLSQSKEKDSIYDMAKDLFEGGGIHGDHALVEAALSLRNFYKLAGLGVPFPHDKYGLYVGYRTDHDSSSRATSAGPLTSKYMTEALEKSVKSKGIPILDDMQLVKLLVKDNEAYGLVALSKDGYKIVFSPNIVLATGGPAGMYRDSVFPPSQVGATGVAFAVGCDGVNLTEWQYGIASTKFRWNLSGTYQQVVPRYVSTDQEGNDSKDFLFEHFSTRQKAIDAVFLKGYQWPFDAKKLVNEGSSNIDLLVYEEIYKKNRRVWLDYTTNICDDWFSIIGPEGKEYLQKCGITEEDAKKSPLHRLRKINPEAYDLYKNNGIDLEKEKLEIAVCAQHNNGGLKVDIYWQSNIKGIFPIGEAAGIYGVYRPGGSALNSTQTGSVRCAEYIKAKRRIEDVEDYVKYAFDELLDSVKETINLGSAFLKQKEDGLNIYELDIKLKKRMSEKAGAIRRLDLLKEALNEAKEDLSLVVEKASGRKIDINMFFYTYYNLISQICYISAMIAYIENGGTSRGSYLVVDNQGNEKTFMDRILVTSYLNGNIKNYWEKVRPIPEHDTWFENVWRDYREGNLFD